MENRIGGLLSVKLASLAQVQLMTTLAGRCHLELQSGASWYELGTFYMSGSSEFSAVDDSSGYVESGVLHLRMKSISGYDLLVCRRYLSGCIVRLESASGEVYYVGDLSFPAVGVVTPSLGSVPSDSRFLQLEISSKSFHVPLFSD